MTKPKKHTKRKMSNEEIWSWYYQNLDVKGRTLYFGTHQPSEELVGEDTSWEVNDWSAGNILKGLYVLEKESSKPIKIVWFSYGGDWDAGMAIYDAMRLCKSPITMVCYGRVRSMGTVILQAADKRIITRDCLFMIHHGSFGLEEMHSKDAMANAKYNEVITDRMLDIYLSRIREKKPRYKKQQLEDLMAYDCFLPAQDAVNLGLADEVI